MLLKPLTPYEAVSFAEASAAMEARELRWLVLPFIASSLR